MDDGEKFAFSVLFIGACLLVILIGLLFHIGWKLLDFIWQ